GLLLMTFIYIYKNLATTDIYTLSLHDALPIYVRLVHERHALSPVAARELEREAQNAIRPVAGDDGDGLGGASTRIDVVLDSGILDRKSTRLNSSHVKISYAVFCLKKKKTKSQC